jgi:AraC-like DNA-binding protein
MLENPNYLRDNPVVNSDPLSEILTFVNAQCVLSGGLVAGGVWALRFPPPNTIKFAAIVRGVCWLSIDGQETPVHLETGDVFLLAARRSFVLASDLSVEPTDAISVFSKAGTGVARLGESEQLSLLGGQVEVDATRGALLLDVLPPLIRVPATLDEATVVHWLLGQLIRETAIDRPGAGLVAAQLAQLMFVQVLRVHLATSGSAAVGWLRALGDERLAPALRLMHSEPGRSWQLGELAKAAAMSRAAFALRFKTIVGVAPLTYLLGWRMRLAERALREGNTRVSELAVSLGYTSESAFSNAFKRTTGTAPKRYQSVFRASEQKLCTSRMSTAHASCAGPPRRAPR